MKKTLFVMFMLIVALSMVFAGGSKEPANVSDNGNNDNEIKLSKAYLTPYGMTSWSAYPGNGTCGRFKFFPDGTFLYGVDDLFKGKVFHGEVADPFNEWWLSGTYETTDNVILLHVDKASKYRQYNIGETLSYVVTIGDAYNMVVVGPNTNAKFTRQY